MSITTISGEEELFGSRGGRGEVNKNLSRLGQEVRGKAATMISESRKRAESVGAGTAAERRAGAAEFATQAGKAQIGSLSGIESVTTPGSKVSLSEATRLDFATVTAPHLLLEKKGPTARGEGVISKKR